MSQYSDAWNLSRQRFLDEIKDLTDAQLRWRIYPTCLSIGEGALHLAGVEISFASQLSGAELSPSEAVLKRAATEGVVNDLPFPFEESQITKEEVMAGLEASRSHLEPLIVNPTPEVLGKEIKSALGPIITGAGAFTRLAFHSAYHHGQSYLIKTSPGFPA